MGAQGLAGARGACNCLRGQCLAAAIASAGPVNVDVVCVLPVSIFASYSGLADTSHAASGTFHVFRLSILPNPRSQSQALQWAITHEQKPKHGAEKVQFWTRLGRGQHHGQYRNDIDKTVVNTQTMEESVRLGGILADDTVSRGRAFTMK